MQKIDLPTDFIQDINGDSTAMQSLLGYVWTNWEDQLDVNHFIPFFPSLLPD